MEVAIDGPRSGTCLRDVFKIEGCATHNFSGSFKQDGIGPGSADYISRDPGPRTQDDLVVAAPHVDGRAAGPDDRTIIVERVVAGAGQKYSAFPLDRPRFLICNIYRTRVVAPDGGPDGSIGFNDAAIRYGTRGTGTGFALLLNRAAVLNVARPFNIDDRLVPFYLCVLPVQNVCIRFLVHLDGCTGRPPRNLATGIIDKLAMTAAGHMNG